MGVPGSPPKLFFPSLQLISNNVKAAKHGTERDKEVLKRSSYTNFEVHALIWRVLV